MFCDRIRKRRQIFWNTPRFSLHGKQRCLLTYLDREDPLEKWRCCPLWQRKLSNKWNAREFVQRMGGRVPELYWVGRQARNIPFSDLPEHYVIKPVVGHSGKGIFVMSRGVNLLDGKRYSSDQLAAAVGAGQGRWSRRRILVESLVQSGKGKNELPMDYKCYTFGDKVAAISCLDRTGRKLTGMDFTESWEPLQALYPPNLVRAAEQPIPPPECLDEILQQAKKLGRAYGSFIRVDFYATPEGAVFGEFASTPTNGNGFTRFADEYLETFWRDYCPDAL
jgi:hypothetical protein